MLKKGKGSRFVIEHFVNRVNLTECKNILQTTKNLLGKTMRKKSLPQFIGLRRGSQTSDIVVENSADSIKVHITHANPTR